MIVYKQKKSLSEYQVIDSNNNPIAGPFFNEISTNSWLFNNGYGTTPCCPPQAFSGNSSNTGYFFYPETGFYPINTPDGFSVTININWYTADNPNRFTVYNSSGSLLWTSGWKGYSENSGPWGASLNTSNTGSTSISGSSGFKLRVETIGSGNETDTWNFNVTCNVGAQISS